MRYLMRILPLTLGILLALMLPAWGQNAVTRPMLQNSAFDPNIQGDWIFSGTLTVPHGTSTTTTECDEAGEAGRIFVDIDAESSQQFYICEGTAGWVRVGGHSPTALTVCLDGSCDYTQVCGITVNGTADLAGAGRDECLPGTLLADHTDPNIPLLVKLGPGRYEEGYQIDRGNITFEGAGREVTVIRPDVTDEPNQSDWDVAIGPAGLIRIGMDSASKLTGPVTFRGVTIQNDAWGSPNPAVRIGDDAAQVYIEDSNIIGAHDAIQGVLGTSTGVDTDVPRVFITGSTVISAADAIARKGNAQFVIKSSYILGMSNYCEAAPGTAYLAEITGTVACDTACTVNAFDLEVADAAGIDDAYVGREVTLSGGGCAAAGSSGWSVDYVDSSRRISTSTDTDFSAVPDSNCTYTIAAVPPADTLVTAGYGITPCQDLDWTLVRASGLAGGFWKMDCWHDGVGSVPAWANDGDFESAAFDLLDIDSSNTCHLIVNDFGPNPGASACNNQQGHLKGLLHYNNSVAQRSAFVSPNILIEINSDLPPVAGCATNVGCVTEINPFEGEYFFSGNCTIRNNADPDQDFIGVEVAADDSVVTVGPSRFSLWNDPDLSWSGTFTQLSQTDGGTTASTLRLAGPVSSTDLFTTAGVIGQLYTMPSGLRGTLTQDIADPSGACLESNAITVTGAALGDVCLLGTSAALPSGVNGTCHVTAANTVKVSLCGTGDPASMTYTVKVMSP